MIPTIIQQDDNECYPTTFLSTKFDTRPRSNITLPLSTRLRNHSTVFNKSLTSMTLAKDRQTFVDWFNRDCNGLFDVGHRGVNNWFFLTRDSKDSRILLRFQRFQRFHVDSKDSRNSIKIPEILARFQRFRQDFRDFSKIPKIRV